MFKTQIIRDALRPVFGTFLDEPDIIRVSNTQFQDFLDKLELPPDQEILERRNHLMKYEKWK